MTDKYTAQLEAIAPSGIEPVDLQSVIDSGLVAHTPDIMFRRDARALLYRGKINVIFGAPEAGKTWWALAAAAERINNAQRMNSGIVVVFLDFEDDARSYLLRMQTLGVDLSAVVQHSRYYSLTTPVSKIAETFDGIDTAELIVIDTTNSAMTLDGLDPVSNKDALMFLNDVRRFRNASQAAWLILDHEPITTSEGRKQAIGAQGKLAAVDGAQYRAVAVEQPRPGAKGTVALYVTKDRNGGVRQHSKAPDQYGNQHAATLMMSPFTGSTRLNWEIIEPIGLEGEDPLRAAVLKVTETDDWLTKKQIRDLVRATGTKGRNEVINGMVDELSGEGLIEGKAKSNWTVYRGVKSSIPNPGIQMNPQLGDSAPTLNGESPVTPTAPVNPQQRGFTGIDPESPIPSLEGDWDGIRDSSDLPDPY